jgi:hypothetical protein
VNRRNDIQALVKTTLIAAKTAAADRVYIGRVKPFDPDHSSDAPPAICIYAPKIEYKLKGVGNQYNYDEDVVFTLELWAKVSPSSHPKFAEEIQDTALNVFVQQAVNALFGSEDFLQEFNFLPDVVLVYGMDMSSESRVGAAILEITGTRKKTTIVSETDLGLVYDDLQQIWIDTDITDPDPDVVLPMTTPNIPDLAQDIPDLEQ